MTTDTTNTTKSLLGLKITKYRISKKLGVHWQSVHRWAKDIHIPKKEHEEKLQELLNETRRARS